MRFGPKDLPSMMPAIHARGANEFILHRNARTGIYGRARPGRGVSVPLSRNGVTSLGVPSQAGGPVSDFLRR